MTDAFHAIADAKRRRILELLGRDELPAGALCAALEVSAPAVSQHLKVLRDTGLVRVRVDGQRRLYSLEPAGFAAVERWLATMRGFWAGRLDALEQVLTQADANARGGEPCSIEEGETS